MARTEMRVRSEVAGGRLPRLLAARDVLTDASRRIAAATTLDAVLRTAVDAVRGLVAPRACAVGLVRDGRVELVVADPPGAAPSSAGAELAEWAVATVQVVQSDGDRGGGYVAVPMVSGGSVVGVVELDVACRLDGDDLASLEWLAAVVSCGVQARTRLAEARRIERVKADFVARVSHELRTPITVMAGVASTLRRHWDAVGDGDRNAMLDSAVVAGERLTRLIEELVTVGSFEVEGDVANPERVELCGLLATVRAESRQPAAVSVECDPSVEVTVDGRLLRHALALLLDNAIAYAGDAELRVVAALDPQEVIVEVRDHGPGIPRELRGRVFDRFTRGDHGAPGSGLGLPLARALAGAIGARLDLECPDDGGCVFRLALAA